MQKKCEKCVSVVDSQCRDCNEYRQSHKNDRTLTECLTDSMSLMHIFCKHCAIPVQSVISIIDSIMSMCAKAHVISGILEVCYRFPAAKKKKFCLLTKNPTQNAFV